MRLKRIGFVLAGFGVVGCVGLAGYEERESYEQCQLCVSERDHHETRVGPIVLTQSGRTTLSFAFRDLLAGHKHDWVRVVFRRWAPGRIISSEKVACGTGLTFNDFVLAYNESADFRAFVLTKIKARALDRNMAARMAIVPRLPEDDPAAIAGDALCVEFFGE